MHLKRQMSFMKSLMYMFCGIFATATVQATGTVDFLKIDNDVLLFTTTTPKADPALPCVDVAAAQQWAVSLTTDEGQGIYAMLLMAVANNQSIVVDSALDCAAVEGIERPNSVSISS